MKKPLLITTLAAGALLVGGTFAAYVVTDNAEKQNVNIGIGQLINDDDKVTLSWGTNSLAAVENLGLGQTADVGSVIVKAANSAQEFEKYDGILDLWFETEANSKLGQYLTYDVYKANGEEKGEKLVAGEDGYAVSATSEGTKYFITVSLAAEIGEEDKTAIQNQAAKLWIDWKKGEGDADDVPPTPELLDTTFKVHAQTDMGYGVYVVGEFSEWKAIEAYRLEYGEGDIWSATIGLEAGEHEFKFVIEHWDEKDIPEKGEDYVAWIPEGPANYVVVAGETADYSGQQQQEDPEPAQYSVKVNGQAINQAPEADPGDNNAVYKLDLASGDKVAFDKGEVALHFYHNEDQVPVDDGAEYTVTIAGEHTFYINTEDHIYVAEPAQEPEQSETVYYVTGKIGGVNKWFDTVGYLDELKMGAAPENWTDKAYIELVLAAGDEFKVIDNADPMNWYGTGDKGEDNFSVTAAGTYRIGVNAQGSAWFSLKA